MEKDHISDKIKGINVVELSKRLVGAGKFLGIEVVDHIIVAKDRFLSFKDQGLI